MGDLDRPEQNLLFLLEGGGDGDTGVSEEKPAIVVGDLHQDHLEDGAADALPVAGIEQGADERGSVDLALHEDFGPAVGDRLEGGFSGTVGGEQFERGQIDTGVAGDGGQLVASAGDEGTDPAPTGGSGERLEHGGVGPARGHDADRTVGPMGLGTQLVEGGQAHDWGGWDQRGVRFSRNAAIPSRASGCVALAVMMGTASS